MQSLINRVNNYSYIEEDMIGKGATGKVYKGINDLTGESVAIKVMDMSEIDNYVTRYLLACEKEALLTIKHPYVLSAYEIVQNDYQCFIVTPLCNGGTLKEYIESKGKLSYRESLEIFHKLLQGYHSIKNNNFVHRDLKSSNVMFAGQNPVIIDFGYCEKLSGPKPEVFYNVGSPSYMSPEAYFKTLYSYKSDIWALGVILYEMVIGTTPDNGLKIDDYFGMLVRNGGISINNNTTAGLIIADILNCRPHARPGVEHLLNQLTYILRRTPDHQMISHQNPNQNPNPNVQRQSMIIPERLSHPYRQSTPQHPLPQMASIVQMSESVYRNSDTPLKIAYSHYNLHYPHGYRQREQQYPVMNRKYYFQTYPFELHVNQPIGNLYRRTQKLPYNNIANSERIQQQSQIPERQRPLDMMHLNKSVEFHQVNQNPEPLNGLNPRLVDSQHQRRIVASQHPKMMNPQHIINRGPPPMAMSMNMYPQRVPNQHMEMNASIPRNMFMSMNQPPQHLPHHPPMPPHLQRLPRPGSSPSQPPMNMNVRMDNPVFQSFVLTPGMNPMPHLGKYCLIPLQQVQNPRQYHQHFIQSQQQHPLFVHQPLHHQQPHQQMNDNLAIRNSLLIDNRNSLLLENRNSQISVNMQNPIHTPLDQIVKRDHLVDSIIFHPQGTTQGTPAQIMAQVVPTCQVPQARHIEHVPRPLSPIALERTSLPLPGNYFQRMGIKSVELNRQVSNRYMWIDHKSMEYQQPFIKKAHPYFHMGSNAQIRDKPQNHEHVYRRRRILAKNIPHQIQVNHIGNNLHHQNPEMQMNQHKLPQNNYRVLGLNGR